MKVTDNDIRQAMEHRLSALDGASSRRARILRRIEREGAPGVGRKWSVGLIAAVALLLTFAGAALALTANLFTLFAERDGRYEKAADQAALATSTPVLAEGVSARFDGALYDGMTLNVALGVERYCRVTEFTPDAQALSSMEAVPELPAFPLDENDGDLSAARRALKSAVEDGIPYGYVSVQYLPSDRVVTDDGIDIPPYRGDALVDEAGRYVEMLEFVSPLPQALQNLDVLTLNCDIDRYEDAWYFDGRTLYLRNARAKAGTIRASVSRSEGLVQEMRCACGAGSASCVVSAQVSAMGAVMTFTGAEGLTLRKLLGDSAEIPGDMDPTDVWIDMTAQDEKGRVYRSEYGLDADQPFPVTQTFMGVGELPQWLDVTVFWTWEGAAKGVGAQLTLRLETAK